MTKNYIDFKYLVLLWIFSFLAIILTYAHHGNFLIDCGREVYYPTQVLLGKILYKDLFNIYGPFSYLFNALLFKIFGINLNVLYVSGSICAFSIVSIIYLIAKRFLSPFLSFSIAFFSITTGILNTNLFNFIFPYSYAMLYGVVAFLVSVLLLLKYSEDSDNILYLYFASFFAGLCITSKYEFLAYILVIIYAIFKIKKISITQCCYVILYFLLPIVLCFGILILQGLRFNDLISIATIINNMAKSQSLKYFYSSQGVYFDWRTIPFILMNALKTLVPLFILIYGLRQKSNFLKSIFVITSFILILVFINPASFIFIPISILLLVILNLRKININDKLTILILAGLAISLKVLWGLATLNYGVYSLGFLLIVILAICRNVFKDKKNVFNAIGLYIVFAAVVLGCLNISSYRNKNYLLTSQMGNIYTEKYFAVSSEDLINYIKNHTQITDKIVIFPEGTFINFLTNRVSDDYYNSMIPLYVEALGENKFIENIKKNKPNYIIFNNYDMSKDYYFKNICNDYAFAFCSFVAQNYKHIKTIDNGFRYLIFKKF